MPQWCNRYQVLRDESLSLVSSDSVSDTNHVVIEKSESPGPMQVMAPSSSVPPDSVSSSPLTLPTSVLPSKIYLRSLKVKVST